MGFLLLSCDFFFRKYSVTPTATVKTGAIAAPHVNKSGSGTAARTRLSTNNGLKKKKET